MRKFNTNQDLYQFVIELANTARLMEQDEIADALEGAFEAGMTASDQLGEIRNVLRENMANFEENDYPESYLKGIKEALKQLDKAFCT